MAKRKNPETSVDAFKSLQPDEIQEIYRKIMKALTVLGAATFEEIARQSKESDKRIWKRLSELERMNLIFRPGIKRTLRSGRKGFCWQLTSDKNVYGEAVEKTPKGKSISDYSKELITKPQQSKLF